MPRLFPSLGRSRDYPREQYQHGGGYDEYEHRNPHTSAWRKVWSRKPRDDRRWEEEMVNYPSPRAQYTAPQGYPGSAYRRPTVEEYQDDRSQGTLTEETYDELYTHDNSIPIVQRESSLTRLQDAFAARGTTSHPVTELSLPTHGTPTRYAQTDTPTPIELHDTYQTRHQPVLVNHTTTESMRPDVEHTTHLSKRARGKRAAYRDDYTRSSSSGSRSLEEEYPACVVVVNKGRHGKKDTYYVIPGGAPVIFQDQYGNEIQRVGDFSGRYKPQPLTRPVIIEDEYGREIHRMGFEDDDNLSRRSDDSYYGTARHGERDYRDRERGRSIGRSSHHSSSRSHAPAHHRDYDNDRYSSRRSERSAFSPNVIYIDPYAKQRSSHDDKSSSRTGTSVRSSPRRHHEQRSYDSRVIELGHHGREVSESSGSSRGRSYYRSPR